MFNIHTASSEKGCKRTRAREALTYEMGMHASLYIKERHFVSIEVRLANHAGALLNAK